MEMTIPVDLGPTAQRVADGRAAEAEADCLRLLEAHPNDPRILHLLAICRESQGNLEGAVEACEAAVANGGSGFDLAQHRADLLRRAGRLEAAADAYRAASALDPAHLQVRLQHALILAALGRHVEAVTAYRAAAGLGAGPKTYNNLGVSLEALGQYEAAVDSYNTSLDLEPGYAKALHNRGSALYKMGRLEAALESFEEALGSDQEAAQTWNFRGVVLERLGRSDEALTSFERAIGFDAGFADAWSNRSASLRALGRFEDARRSALEALRLRPNYAEALNALGAALTRLRRLDEAKAAFEAALALHPDDVSVHLNYGMALEAAGDLDDALVHFGAAEALDPAAPEPTYAIGLVKIRQGDLPEGLKRFEVRWSQKNGPPLRYPQDRLWLGGEPIEGRRILVHGEQGFGDVIQFARFIPELEALGAKVTVEAQPGLVRLLASLKGGPEVIPQSFTPPDFDWHVPVMSLALALGKTLEDVGRISFPYLAPPAPVLSAWRERLGPKSALRIGLAWSGNPKHTNDAERSIALKAFDRILELPADFVSLQPEVRAVDRAYLDRSRIRQFEADIEDFADTAAMVADCDLVIAVDTSVVHLAGALGVPAYLLLPTPCDFRWMNGRADTPWYPSVEIVRQPRPFDWDAVLGEVEDRLKRRLR